MALHKRGHTWWVRFTHNGKRIQRSTGTSDRQAAQEFHDKIKAELWRVDKLNEKPQKSWMEAVVRWLEESQHKRSLGDDKCHLRWLHPHLQNKCLRDINRDVIDEIARTKKETGVSPARVNRMLALIRAILRKAEREWGWIDRAPAIQTLSENNKRIRWITQEEATRLLNELPTHLADMAAFTLATGLRMSNVTNLRWEDVDMTKHHAWIHADQAKANKAIAVPLNDDAIAILKKQVGKHLRRIFTYKGKPVAKCNTRAWREGLSRAGIENFRWHDLRHTWASWHVQSGTSLQELQQLGGWASFEMVLRYAHLSGDHLRKAANRVSGTFLVQSLATKNSPRNEIVITA